MVAQSEIGLALTNRTAYGPPSIIVRRFLQYAGASAALAVTVVAAWREWWPFDAAPKALSSYFKPTVWQFLLSDRLTLGLLRLGLAALVIYMVVSLPALIVAGRWLRGFGTSGVSFDDAQDAKEMLEKQEEAVQRLTTDLERATEQMDVLRNERDQAIRTLREVVTDATRTTTRPATLPIIGEERSADEQSRTREDQEDAS